MADLLTAPLEALDNDDSLTDQEVRDQVVSLIAGGYETTAALAAWTAYAVLSNPVVEDNLRRELTIFDARPTTRDTIARCAYLDAVINETLRFFGPTPFSARYAPEAFEFLGHAIPARSTILYSSYVTHRLDSRSSGTNHSRLSPNDGSTQSSPPRMCSSCSPPCIPRAV